MSWWPRHGQLGVHNNTGLSTCCRGSIYFKPQMDAQPRWTHRPRAPRCLEGVGGARCPAPHFQRPPTRPFPAPFRLQEKEGCQEGVPPHPPLRWAPPSLPGEEARHCLLLWGFAAWGGTISRHWPMDRREVISLSQLRMFTWALINGYGYRAGGRKGTVTERGPGRLGGKRKVETEAERWREGGKRGRETEQQTAKATLLDVRPVTCGDHPECRGTPNSSPELHPAGASRTPSPSVFQTSPDVP